MRAYKALYHWSSVIVLSGRTRCTSCTVAMATKRKSDGEGTGAKKAKADCGLDEVDFSSKAKNPSGEQWNLKISSWNVNGLRAWLGKTGTDYILREDPDIFCLQETKCSKSKVPAECNIDGYHVYWLEAEKDGYSGVGLYSKKKPLDVKYGIGVSEHDNEGRVITAEYSQFYLVTAYVPNSGRGLVRLQYRTQEWDVEFRKYLKTLDAKKPVILCGDLNVAHKEIDLKNPKTNKKTAGFTPEERQEFSKLLDENKFVDTFRHLYPDKKEVYSFWTYMMNARAKNTGWRLDYFVVSESVLPKVCDSIIRTDVLGSDHCPVVLLLHV